MARGQNENQKSDARDDAADVKDPAVAPEQAKILDQRDEDSVEARNDPNDNARVDDQSAGIGEPEVPLQPAVVDHTGTARLLPTPDRNWEPAPLEATAEEIARAEKRNAREEEVAEAYKAGRVDPVSGRIREKDND